MDMARRDKLAREVTRAKQAHAEARKTAAELRERVRDLSLTHPDGSSSVRQAIKIERAAAQRLGTALTKASLHLLGEAREVQQRATLFQHAPSTGHFRCVCGKRLTFGTQSKVCEQLVDVGLDGSLKFGRCPGCGATHVVAR